MLFKDGVSLRGVRPETVLAMVTAEDAWRSVTSSEEMCITSVTDAVHHARSFHYNGLAFDVRTHVLTPFQKPLVLAAIKSRLMLAPVVFQCVFEDADGPNEHLHVEHDDGHELPWTKDEQAALWLRNGWTLEARPRA